MPQLSLATRQQLIDNAKQVFRAFSSFSFFKQKLTGLEGHSIAELCQQLIVDQKQTVDFSISGYRFKLQLQPSNSSYKLSIKLEAKSEDAEPVSTVTEVNDFPIKSIEQYSELEKILALVSKSALNVECNAVGIAFLTDSLKDGEWLGGVNKVELYNTHLITLHNIIDKLEQQENLSSLLVAQATGSGKTYIQALWIYILHLAKLNAVFAVPDKLVSQFQRDLSYLLPRSVVNQILTIRQGQDSSEWLANLKTSYGQLVVASYEHLLDDCYLPLSELSSEQLLLSFDEQHLVVEHEARKVKLFELANRFVSLFLTATPSEETYLKSGAKPVAVMSSGQKQRAGQGRFPSLFTVRAKSVSDKHSMTTYNVFSRQFWQELSTKFVFSFAENVQSETANAALATLSELPFMYTINDNEQDMRWSLEQPMARKMLVITDDNEDVVNIFHFLKHEWNMLNPMVYQDGNLVDRKKVFQFFEIPNQDEQVCFEYHQAQEQKFIEQLEDAMANKSCQQPVEMLNTNLKQQLKRNIFHNIIELLLQDITGLSSIALNQMRKQDLPALVALVASKLKQRDQSYFYQKFLFDSKINPKGIDEEGAAELSTILFSLNEKMIEGKSSGILNFYVDNWSQDSLYVEHLQHGIAGLNAFTERHLVLAVMANMTHSEMPIDDSQPFFDLSEERYLFHKLPKKAKLRKHNAVESLNEQSQESRFSPIYFQQAEEIADNYFRLGLVGMYVSNKKTEGFSDANLHTVINLSNHSYSNTNNPQILVQGIGRNRGLDDTVTPAYVHGIGKATVSPFELESLTKDDYFPDLYQAQIEYNQLYLENISKKVCADILLWIKENTTDDDAIDESSLKRKVLKSICTALRALNRANGHQLKISRALLSSVLAKTMQQINQEIDALKQPYKLSLFVRVVGSIINFCCEVYFYFGKLKAVAKLHWVNWFAGEQPLSAADALYGKTIMRSSFKELVAQTAVANEVQSLLKHKALGLLHTIKSNPSRYLKEPVRQTITNHCQQAFVPMILNLVVGPKQQQIEQALQQVTDWPHQLVLLAPLLQSITSLQNGTELDKSRVLLVLSNLCPQIRLLESDIILPKERAVKLRSHFDSLQFLSSDKKFKKQLIDNISYSMEESYIAKFLPLFSIQHRTALAEKLQDQAARKAFVQLCVDGIQSFAGEFPSEQEMLLLLQMHYQLPELKTQQTHLQNCNKLAEQLQLLLAMPKCQLVNEATIAKLSAVTRDDLLPVLVNFYPEQDRAALYFSAKNADMTSFIQNSGHAFFDLLQTDQHQAAHLLFDSLKGKDSTLPTMLDLAEQKGKALSVIDKFKSVIKQKTLLDLAWQNTTSFNLFNPIRHPQYAIAPEVVNFLQSDDFKVLTSAMPYDNAREVNHLLQDSSQAYKFAYALIDDVNDKGEANYDANKLVACINRALGLPNGIEIKTNEQRAQLASKQLQPIQSNLIGSLREDIKADLHQKMLDDLVPLICAFLHDEEKQQRLMNAAKRVDLVAILYQHQDLLMQFQKHDDDFEHQRPLLLMVANEIGGGAVQFKENDFYDFKKTTDNNIKQLKQSLKEQALANYLCSDDFFNHLALLFNGQDVAVIQNVLLSPRSGQDTVNWLAREIVKAKLSLTDPELLANFIVDKLTEKEGLQLASVKPLQLRVEQAVTYCQKELGSDSEILKQLNVAAINSALRDSIMPLFSQPQFRELVENTIGFLSEQEIALFLCASAEVEPIIEGSEPSAEQQQIAQQANKLFAFITAIRQQDWAALAELIQFSQTNDARVEIENSPLEQIFRSIVTVMLNIKDIHCYFNQHNDKGLADSTISSKFLETVSEQMRLIRVAMSSDSRADQLCRRIFFIQGVRNGLPKASKMAEFANKATIERLQRINQHILRPLWWGNNVSQLGFAFVKLGQAFYYNIILASYYAFANGLKSGLNTLGLLLGLTETAIYQLEQLDAEDLACQEMAFSYAQALNHLQPLTAEEIAREPAKQDVIETLEAFVENQEVTSAMQSPLDETEMVNDRFNQLI